MMKLMPLRVTVDVAWHSVAVRKAVLPLTLILLAVWLTPSLAQQPRAPAGQAPAGQAPAGQAPPRQPPVKAPPGKPAVKRPTARQGPGAKSKEEEEKPPAPETSYLRTKDGWSIYCTYYGPQEGVRSGKEVVPVILLHDWEGQGTEYSRFAVLLQTIGCAVMVPDLRGHGRSTSVRRPDLRTGELKDEEVRVDDLKPADLVGMVYDVEAIKKVLMERHNNAELNIEMLCVGGAGVGGIVAINWAAMDWSWPLTPSYKQGQDVKGLILLSPRQTFKRLSATEALKTLSHPAVRERVSIMVAVGNAEQRPLSDANRIYNRLKQGREEYTDTSEKMRKQTHFYFEQETSYQGTKLLEPQLRIWRSVGIFLKLRFFDKVEEYPWAERKSPLQ